MRAGRAPASRRRRGRGRASVSRQEPGHCTLRGASLRAQRVERCVGRERLRIELEVQQRGLAAAARALEGRREFLGPQHRLAVRAVGARQRREIRIDEVGARDARRIVALLVHADRAVHAVVDDDEDRPRARTARRWRAPGRSSGSSRRRSRRRPCARDARPWRRPPPARHSPSRRSRARAACGSRDSGTGGAATPCSCPRRW